MASPMPAAIRRAALLDARDRLRIGLIPPVDAAALMVAVDKGFTAAEGLDVLRALAHMRNSPGQRQVAR